MTTGPLAGKLTTESDGKVATDDDLLPVAVSRSVALIAELPATALSPLTTELGLPTLADLPPARPQTIRRRRHRPQLEMLAGAAYAHQQFGLRDPAAGEARELREVSEFPQLSYQFSLRARYRLGERWRLLGGLTYVDIRNQLEYELRQGGRTDLLRANNHLRLLEVPLLASYEISGRRLNLSLNAGPVVNLLLAPAGGYLEPAAAMPLPLAESVDYRGNLGLGWTASLTTTYALGRGGATRLLLEPFFKHYPRSVTRPSASLSEHYWLAGLQLGLRRSF